MPAFFCRQTLRRLLPGAAERAGLVQGSSPSQVSKTVLTFGVLPRLLARHQV